MKYLALITLAVLGGLTAAMPSTVALNERFQQEYQERLNAGVDRKDPQPGTTALNQRFKQERQETLNSSSNRFKQERWETLNSSIQFEDTRQQIMDA